MFISFTDKDKLLRCFFVISGLISGGGNFFKVGGAVVDVKNLWKIFFIKQFTLTMDPILIVLLKHI